MRKTLHSYKMNKWCKAFIVPVTMEIKKNGATTAEKQFVHKKTVSDLMTIQMCMEFK